MKHARILILSGLILFTAYLAHAQGGAQGGSTNGPIDGGAVALLFGAAVYGYRKLHRKEKTEE